MVRCDEYSWYIPVISVALWHPEKILFHLILKRNRWFDFVLTNLYYVLHFVQYIFLIEVKVFWFKMSLTMQQIVMDAKNLANKLKDSNNAADALLSQGQTVHRQIDTMKQYADEINDLNEMAKHRPHAALVAGIQQENRHLRDLQQENRELRAALEEQQNALELIMSKYRQQITKLAHSSQIDLTKLYNKKYTEIIIDQAIKISEMTHIMGKAIQADEDSILKTEEELHQLATENKGLRELLAISSKHNSISLVNEPYT